MAESTIPGTGDTSEAGWRDIFPRSGVTNDTTGSGCRVTANGASQTVVVSPGTALVEGFLYENDANKSINLGATGTQPTSGQERYSRIVLRLDTSSTPYVVTAVAIVGSPAASGAGSVPPLVRSSTTYDFALATVRQTPASISQSAVSDEREWWGEHRELASGKDLDSPTAPPIGSTRGKGSVLYRRVFSGGSVDWMVDDSADTTGAYVDGQPSGVTANATASNDWITQAAVKNGVVLSASRRYQLSVFGVVTPTASGGAGFRANFIDGNEVAPDINGWAESPSSPGHFSASFVYEPTGGTKSCAIRVRRRPGSSGDLAVTGARWHIIDIGPRS